jgi:hypothetical protein
MFLIDERLPIREDIKRGGYIDGITEEPIGSPEDASRVRL